MKNKKNKSRLIIGSILALIFISIMVGDGGGIL